MKQLRTSPNVPHRPGPLLLAAILTVGSLVWGGAASAWAQDGAPDADLESLSGTIEVDGSSTVGPITELVAERFRAQATGVKIRVNISGTGGGFDRFCAGETDLQDASRPIAADEAAACAAAGVGYFGFEVALDGITVVVNPANDFVSCLTVEQLRRLWMPDSPVTTWRDLDPAWPEREIALSGPGPASGTFDYFTEVIVGDEDASREDYSYSEDDTVLVEEVAAAEDGLGYFGFAYYEQNQDRLKAVAVDAGAGCVAPSPATINDGSYRPLARPIYIYVSQESLARAEVREFVRFYLAAAREVVSEVGYVSSPDAVYAAAQAKLEGAIGGTVPLDGAATPAP